MGTSVSVELSTLRHSVPIQEANRLECDIPTFLEICPKVYEPYIQVGVNLLFQEFLKSP